MKNLLKKAVFPALIILAIVNMVNQINPEIFQMHKGILGDLKVLEVIIFIVYLFYSVFDYIVYFADSFFTGGIVVLLAVILYFCTLISLNNGWYLISHFAVLIFFTILHIKVYKHKKKDEEEYAN